MSAHHHINPILYTPNPFSGECILIGVVLTRAGHTYAELVAAPSLPPFPKEARWLLDHVMEIVTKAMDERPLKAWELVEVIHRICRAIRVHESEMTLGESVGDPVEWLHGAIFTRWGE